MRDRLRLGLGSALGLVFAITLLSVPGAAQRSQCTMERLSSPTPEQTQEYTWRLNTRGRVRWHTEHNRSVQQAFRYGPRGDIRLVEEHPFNGEPENAGRPGSNPRSVAPVVVTRPREGVVRVTVSPAAGVETTTVAESPGQPVPSPDQAVLRIERSR